MPQSQHLHPIEAPEPSTPGRLLAALLSAGTLVQPEPVLTRTLRFLLGLPGGSHALDGLIEEAGVAPPKDGFWLTEVGHESGGRTDLEYWGRGQRAPAVVVEAKIGHLLEASQVAGYRPRLAAIGGLLVALVPSSRVHFAQTVVAQLRRDFDDDGDTTRVALWTWDQVAEELIEALPENPDVVQLKGLIQATGAMDVEPFSVSQLFVPDDTRIEDLWRIVSRASSMVSGDRRPAQPGGPYFRWRFVSAGDFGAEFRVGVGRSERTDHETWVWASVDDSLRFGRVAMNALLENFSEAESGSGGVAVPVHLDANIHGSDLVDHVRDQLDAIARAIRRAVADDAARAEEANRGKPVAAPAELIGIPPFSSEDLLDSSGRRADVLEVLRTVMRQARRGKKAQFKPDEPFEHRGWIGLDPHATHISLGVGRTDPSTTPRPWAWLSVHEVTAHSDIAFEVLDRLFPESVVDIPLGRAVPVEIPVNATGVQAFHSVLAQVEHVMSEIRKALAEQIQS